MSKHTKNNLRDENYNLWVLLDHARVAIFRSRELELAPLGLTPEQVSILNILHKKGGAATNAEIADITLRQYNSVCTMINRLHKLGLVKKQRSPTYKKYVVSITPKGKSKYEKITKVSVDMAFSDLSPKDKQQLASYLENIINKSRRMLGVDFKPPFLSK